MNLLLRVIAWFVQSLLWLGIVLSPALVGGLIGLGACAIYGEFNYYLLATFTCFGLIAGIFWAEKIKAGVCLSVFWGRLIAHKEFKPN